MPNEQPYATNGDGGRNERQHQAIRAAAHELRTSLTAIRGFAELLRSEGAALDEAARDEMLGFIISNASAEEDVIDRWLADRTAANDGPSPSPGALVLRDEAEALVGNIAPLLGGDRVDLEIPGGLTVLAEKGALREVITNLLVNAVKYSPPDSRITVTSRVSSEHVIVSVHNTGVISTADLLRIFDRGYRAPNSDDQEGSGLGLNIVKELVDGAGGRIWAESTQNGTSVSFTLRQPLMVGRYPLPIR